MLRNIEPVNRQKQQIAEILFAEIIRQDPDAIDLSDDSLTQIQVFEVLDLLDMASAVQRLCFETYP